MKTMYLLPVCFLLLASCGGDSDDDNDQDTQTEQPAPDVEEEEDDTNNDSFTRTARCRRAEEIEGSDFVYEFSTPRIGDLLHFDTRRNLVRVSSSLGGPATNPVSYEVVPPEEGTVGSQGTITYQDVEMFFPVVPFGTVQGSDTRYLIGTLSRGDTDLGTYLCSRRLQNELSQ